MDTVRPYLSFWPLFLVLTLVTFSASLLYLRYTPPQYEISGKILVKDEKKGLSAPGMLEAIDLFGGSKIVENEIDILKSWPLTETVVKELHLYSSLYSIGYVSSQELYGTKSPLQLIAHNPDSLSSSAEPIPVQVNFSERSIRLVGKTYKAGESVAIGNSHFRIQWNERYEKKQGTEEYLLRISTVYAKAKAILSNLTVEPTSKQSTVIDLKYTTIIPQQG